MIQHFCDNYIHKSCLVKIYKENNENLGYDVDTNCMICKEKFYPEQIELSYGLKEHIAISYINGHVECPLCFDIPVEKRKFPDPLISANKPHDPNDIKISITIIQDLLSKQDFDKLQQRWMHQVYIQEENKKNKLVQTVLCPGFKKIKDPTKETKQQRRIKRKNQNQNQNREQNQQNIEKNINQQQNLENDQEEEKKEDYHNDKTEFVRKEDFKKKLCFGNNKLGFEIQICQALYEYETTQTINKDKSLKPIKISCKACKLEFCPLCMDIAHKKSCENFKKWKQNLQKKGDLKNKLQQDQQFIDQLVKNNPNQYKYCPNCKSLIEKDGGCNRVTCVQKNCKKSICWVCLKVFNTAALCYAHLALGH
ncbi:hypothetical protein PPERSA_10536 [Pseudocohnilembus persalinus]|uniref:RBR-type E3 ubiquitin transferase n=1 Tax=Pseudocohnilembus persalinus TaxID=266149 RepID=A0A0V0R876_PSEPJ|nr:hypothetical protein PPERSA_10536 [Pseudocohnilembus persalinus]|eukprot:KRX10437.1 hypothetical protein PPERSA_10536 [Pseudocohnilembus persalinus]